MDDVTPAVAHGGVGDGDGLVISEDATRATFPRDRLVDAAVVAAYLEVERDWVYVHADELGALRLGSGVKPRLRFSLPEVDRRLTACSEVRKSPAPEAAPAVGSRRRGRARAGTSVGLLPIRGVRE